MKLHYIPPEKLRTGNQEIDEKIGFLLGCIHGDLQSILEVNNKYISCEKLDEALENNLYGFSPIVLQEVKKVLLRVRKVIELNFHLNSRLRNISSLPECSSVISDDEKKEMSIHTLNHILTKCMSARECEIAIAEYGNDLEFNSITYCCILRVLLTDFQHASRDLTPDILFTLKLLNSFHHLEPKTKAYLRGVLTSASKENRKLVYTIIENERLENLSSLIPQNPSTPSPHFLRRRKIKDAE